ncbi:MAG TPA: response regulator transcription factor [Ktedonobacterales bacterium]
MTPTSGSEAQEARRVILVVEDDQTLRETLAYNLGNDGYEVLTAADGVRALELARTRPVALVLLDVMLPRLDGLAVCRQLRAARETAQLPILMLTARGDESDKVVGLELGADDYVTKPFGWAELRARIRALLRRGEQAPASGRGAPADEVLEAGDLRIDIGRREVRRGTREIELPARLFDLLAYMVRNRGLVLTRDRLLQAVWGYEYAGDTRTVDVHIRWLRERIEDDPAAPVRIQTVRGVGYRFR